MYIDIQPGKYVVAVSGGVDSMVLLDMLAYRPGIQLIVAHFDHGIRPDSAEDLRLVAAAAEQYGLPFASARGNLGAGASEALARTARYAFLHSVLAEHDAQAIVTAHHQDDVLETALINMLRGTGRRGLSSLRSSGDIVRPLLGIPKKELMAYAQEHALQWREDSTNRDDRYLRNYLRLHVLPAMPVSDRTRLLHAIQRAGDLNDSIDELLHAYTQHDRLERKQFVMLPHLVAAEVMAGWLRHHHTAFDRRTVERLTVFAKTALPGKRTDVDAAYYLQAGKEHITLLVKPARS